jgi:hypothetical protein
VLLEAARVRALDVGVGVLLDYGATLRASGQRTAAREPLSEALALAARP